MLIKNDYCYASPPETQPLGWKVQCFGHRKHRPDFRPIRRLQLSPEIDDRRIQTKPICYSAPRGLFANEKIVPNSLPLRAHCASMALVAPVRLNHYDPVTSAHRGKTERASAHEFDRDAFGMKPRLTIKMLKAEAKSFAAVESSHHEPGLYGVTDGKAVGTYLERKFREHLLEKYEFFEGNSAKGIDFPQLGVDMKVTSVKQPQSSCPFKSARQKIFGLGYTLLVFVYNKTDDAKSATGNLSILHAAYVAKKRTADFQTTTGIRRILANEGNRDDLLAFFQERMLPIDEIEASRLADELLSAPPEVGYLTISNALQWRLQYARIIEKAGTISGIQKLV